VVGNKKIIQFFLGQFKISVLLCITKNDKQIKIQFSFRRQHDDVDVLLQV
jgi:hypothetical protein